MRVRQNRSVLLVINCRRNLVPMSGSPVGMRDTSDCGRRDRGVILFVMELGKRGHS